MTYMASWKEKGVVPDSDDEEFLDIQSNASDADHRNEPRINDYDDHEEITGRENIEEGRGKGGGNSVVEAADEEIFVFEGTSVDGNTIHEEQSLPPHTAGPSKPDAEDRRLFPSSSPAVPQVFRVPQALEDLGQDWTDSENESAARGQDVPTHTLPVEDEISKSYVRLTSPVSSVLSSLSGSRQSSASMSQSNIARDQRNGIFRIHHCAPTVDSLMDEDAILHALQESATPYKRQFRQRAPIQLKPYAIEQEKYRQTLKARGVKPMRLAQTQDDDRRREEDSSPGPDSQELGSQVVQQETEESQPMDLSWDSESLVPRRNVEDDVKSSQRSEGEGSNNNEEFPDIDELLQGHHSATQRMQSKRRMKTYSSRRPKLSRIQTQTQSTDVEHRAASIFDVPASPPATSSPFPTTARSIQDLASRAISISSREPTPSWLDQDELDFQTAPDLPTPATSVIKPVSNPIFLDSDLDDDPFANEVSDLASSSSDESIQLRKVGKKIRGVLPASHLRLDQQLKKQKPPARTQRDTLSASPQKSTLRRGIALPKAPGATQATSSSTNNAIAFISDESEDEEEIDQSRVIMGDNGRLDSIFPQNRRGYAEEEDRIDAMLPSLKRQKRFSSKPRKKMRIRSAGQSHQPKITQHLTKASSSKSHASRRTKMESASRKSYGETPGNYRTPRPPRLSILDVTDLVDRTSSKVPQFIKVAARTARSKADQGRQSPSKKFIRLANREDTIDVQSVLEQWRNGKIKPRSLEYPLIKTVDGKRTPLGQIADNHQIRLQPPVPKVKPLSQTGKSAHGNLDLPRRLVVSKGQRVSMTNFVSVEQLTIQQSYSNSITGPKSAHHITKRRPANPRYRVPQARPAQLESSEIEYSRQNPAAAFKTTKKALDALFRVNRKRPVQQKNLQLNRFLANEDIIRPSVETSAPLQPDDSLLKRLSTEPTIPLPRQRKRVPRRIDAGAAQYRQPSEPLILDLLAPSEAQKTTGQENKLMGLGKFGFRYPTHFDIFPLQSGIFFHESTFIGSGRLSQAIKVAGVTSSGATRGYTCFRLGDKDFRWGPWNEDVSSQVGLAFDILLEQLLQRSTGPDLPDIDGAGLITNIVDYVQHSLSFTSFEARADFLSRMLEVIQEFSLRTATISFSAEQRKVQQGIDVMARCTVLILQLLQISRAEQSVMSFHLEDLLKAVAGHCVKLCLYQGLDGVRKLYDDLQYLSFRERGIRNDQYTTHSLVVILRVLDTARIPKGSFWDVTNTALTAADMNHVDDARIMEKAWYSIFSLLPLCEFDEFGVVIPGRRHRASFDNWSLLQRMLKRVFAFYSSDARQSPSFNDYCRVLISRSHFLMVEWGWWKCSGIIGTLLDFFASQKLSHLRNEEVYKSPRFLEELDAEPSLDVEPEDRCFHIFLKIVSLAIKHLRHAGDLKTIRNLVARLLPNHDRQYPKEETIHQRDLAALRNHHDLLCTLYWASPPDCRPSPNLIQELVSADRSHKEACLINLRAWGNLSRYVFTSPFASNETAAYQQFIDWQDAFFDKLLRQYLDADLEVRRQADLLLDSGGGAITEAQLQKTIASNRRSTMAAIQALIADLIHNINNARDANATLRAFNFELLSKILTPKIFGVYKDIDPNLIGTAIKALEDYMKRADTLHPFAAPQCTLSGTEGESQDSIDFVNLDIERQMLIFPLHQSILPNFATMIRDILERRLYHPVEPVFMKDLVSCWAHLVSLITEQKYNRRDFITSGINAVFENRQQHERADKYWPWFLTNLIIRDKGFNEMNVTGFDLGAEWMQAVTRPPSSLTFEPSLSRCLFEFGHYLLKSHPELRDFDWLSADHDWPRRHQYLIHVALNSIRVIKGDPAHGGFADKYDLSEKERQSLLSRTLKCTMDSMQHRLESMIPQSKPHTEYVEFCQNVVSYLRAFTNNIQPVTDFFIRQSINYWPKGDDPHLYAAGIDSYSLRLNDQPGKTSFELFHYLYSGWKNDQMHHRLNNHATCVRKGMKNWSFTEFMLTNFVPATLLVAFNTSKGDVLPKIYLPLLAKRVPHYLQRNGLRGASTFTHLINLMKLMINGLSTRAVNALSRVYHVANGILPIFQDSEHGVHADHQGIMSIICQFWIAIRPALLDYVGVHPEEGKLFDEVASPLVDFFRKVTVYLSDPDNREGWDVNQLEVTTGEYVDRFVIALQEDIENHWELSRDFDAVRITATGGGRTTVSLVEGVSRLEDVLKLGMLQFGDGSEQFVVRPAVYDESPVTAFPGIYQALF